MAYNTQQQERFFQTKRIQVVESHLSSYGNARSWMVIRRDMYPVPSKIHQCYFRASVSEKDAGVRRYGFWSDELAAQPKNIAKSSAHNKSDAIRIAKTEAVRLSLPFDPTRDLIGEAEFENGPEQSCVACHEQTRVRSHLPVVCDKCKTALPVGRDRLAGCGMFGIEAHDLVQYFAHAEDDPERGSTTLAKLLLQLAGSALLHPQAYEDTRRRVLRGDDRASFEGRWVYGCYLSDDQAALIEQTVAHIRKMIDAARTSGQKDGESILRGLAAGRMTVEEFNKITIHKPEE